MSLSDNAIFSLKLRVEELKVDTSNIKEIILEFEDEKIIIPNQPGKSLSLKIFVGINNNGKIEKEEAKKALEIFGDELRKEAKKNPKTHPNIDRMEEIYNGILQPAKIKIINN